MWRNDFSANLQTCPAASGKTELHGEQQWIRDRLWAWKSPAERRTGEHRCCSLFSFSTPASVFLFCHFLSINPVQVTFYVILTTSRISLSTKAVNVTLLLETWGDFVPFTSASDCLLWFLDGFLFTQDKQAAHSDSPGVGQGCFWAGDAGIWVGVLFCFLLMQSVNVFWNRVFEFHYSSFPQLLNCKDER